MSVETFYAFLLNLVFLVCGSLICSCFALSCVAIAVTLRMYSLEALLVAATCICSKIPLKIESGLNLKLYISPAKPPVTCSTCSPCWYSLWLIWFLTLSWFVEATFLVVVDQAGSSLKLVVESNHRTLWSSDLTLLSPLIYFLSLSRVTIAFWAKQVFFLWEVSLSTELQSSRVEHRSHSVN